LSTFRPRDFSDGNEEGRGETPLWALRFISGKYQGGEFPLRPHREIIIGRSSDLDMVLVEDMVSRKHAKITTDDAVVTIQDLGSTNGTFVNGEKVRKAELKDGDRILIGTSIIKMVYVEGDATNNNLSETEARSKMAVAANKRTTPKSMSGSIEEIPLPDLIQLLSTSRKSGLLVVRTDHATGRLYLRKGQIYFANIEDTPSIGPRKAIIRMLSWAQGSFELEPPDESPVPEEMDESTEGLLMEGMRQLDEYRVQLDKLPALTSTLSVPRPLTPKLRELAPEELDVFQAVLEATTINSLFDKSPLTDLAVAEKLRALLEKGYVTAS
jgi:pSer/pThr/pTyr-binding forkhead associated (FHA) protein